MSFLENERLVQWTGFIRSPDYYAWRENAFEILCLNHVPQMKDALGIRAVETTVYTWRSKDASPGIQIDLLIERKDGVVNLCEMKCSDQAFVIDALYEKQLLQKIEVFRKESKTNKAIHLTFVTANGLARNAYSGIVINVITGDDLFR